MAKIADSLNAFNALNHPYTNRRQINFGNYLL